MKLNKVEEKTKNKNKKAIIIIASTATVLTLSGLAGWNFFRQQENRVSEFTRSIVSGQNVKKTLADEEDEFVLDPPTVKSLQNLLSKTGFGYTAGVYDYKYNEATQDMVDKHSGSTTKAEDLYIMCNQDEIYSYEVFATVDFPTYIKNFLFGNRRNNRKKDVVSRCKR